MKAVIRFIFIVLVGLLLFRARITGILLTPLIEDELGEIFAMPITAEGLYFDPFTGDLRVRRFRFLNQPEFTVRPHINIEGLKAYVNVRALFQQKVLIDKITMERLDYLIERHHKADDVINNAKKMVRGVKAFRKMRRERREKERLAKGLSVQADEGTNWEILIRDIHFINGSFTYEHYSDGALDSRYYFHELDGILTDLRFPSDPKVLNQTVKLKGVFGELYPVPFWVEGKANFIRSVISFDLNGQIQEGPIKEYERLWKGIPVDLQGGVFEIFIHAVCHMDYLKEDNKLILKSLKVSQPAGVTEKIWGLPMLATLKFLETEKTITLNVPLEGDISDPRFEFSGAFRIAFQEALKHHTISGINFIRESPAKIAEQTQELAASASGKLVGGVEQVTGLVRNQTEAIGKVLTKEK